MRRLIWYLAWSLSVLVAPAAMAPDRGLAIAYSLKVADIPGRPCPRGSTYASPLPSRISYYSQGRNLAGLLDLSIRHDTNGASGLSMGAISPISS